MGEVARFRVGSLRGYGLMALRFYGVVLRALFPTKLAPKSTKPDQLIMLVLKLDHILT